MQPAREKLVAYRQRLPESLVPLQINEMTDPRAQIVQRSPTDLVRFESDTPLQLLQGQSHAFIPRNER